MLSQLEVSATIPAKDLSRARKFYEEKLGLKAAMEESDGGIVYQDGCTYFTLYPSQFAGTATHTLMSWQTSDLDREMADLRSRGIKFEEYDLPGLKTVNGVALMGKSRGAWFKDTEGNILALFQPE